MSSRNGGTILAVDDCSDDLLLLRQAFRKHGAAHLLREVRSGAQALMYLSGCGEYVDRVANPFPAVMLIDIKMPAMTGLELLERIDKMFLPQKPQIIMLSTSRMPSDIRRANESGATAYLSKPVSYSDFLLFVGNILAQSNDSAVQPQMPLLNLFNDLQTASAAS